MDETEVLKLIDTQCQEVLAAVADVLAGRDETDESGLISELGTRLEILERGTRAAEGLAGRARELASGLPLDCDRDRLYGLGSEACRQWEAALAEVDALIRGGDDAYEEMSAGFRSVLGRLTEDREALYSRLAQSERDFGAWLDSQLTALQARFSASLAARHRAYSRQRAAQREAMRQGDEAQVAALLGGHDEHLSELRTMWQDLVLQRSQEEQG